MNNNFTNTELLIQLLDGELDTEQTAALEKNIREDASMADELESLRLAKDTVKRYGLQNRIHTIHAEMMDERSKDYKHNKPGISGKIISYSMRIAASVILLLGISFLYQYYSASPEKLFDENFQSFNLRQNRGNTATPLQDAYAAGDMKDALRQYSLLKDPSPENNFLAGNAYLSIHQPAKAIAVFLLLQQQNATANTHYYEQDTEYYLALAYLLNHQAGMALPLLEKINAGKNHTYHQKVSNWFLSKAKRLDTPSK